MTEKILISACLLGEKCRYDGNDNLIPEIAKKWNIDNILSCCPEVLGGLPTPREPAEIINGTATHVLNGNAQVITKNGVDVTKEFIAGAYETLKLATENNIKVAILKERSPSCGSCKVYDGTFKGTKINGAGLTTALLRQHGIKIYSEENYEEELFQSTTEQFLAYHGNN